MRSMVEGARAEARRKLPDCASARGLHPVAPPPPRFARSPSPAARVRIWGALDPPPSLATGEGDHAKHGGGGTRRSEAEIAGLRLSERVAPGRAPSTALRAVPLPRCAGEDLGRP